MRKNKELSKSGKHAMISKNGQKEKTLEMGLVDIVVMDILFLVSSLILPLK